MWKEPSSRLCVAFASQSICLIHKVSISGYLRAQPLSTLPPGYTLILKGAKMDLPLRPARVSPNKSTLDETSTSIQHPLPMTVQTTPSPSTTPTSTTSTSVGPTLLTIPDEILVKIGIGVLESFLSIECRLSWSKTLLRIGWVSALKVCQKLRRIFFDVLFSEQIFVVDIVALSEPRDIQRQVLELFGSQSK
jgi:hypothetical protein